MTTIKAWTKLPAANSMFLQWCRDELAKSFYLRSTFLFRGQEPASKRHHCRNTNVGSKQLDEETPTDNIDSNFWL